MRLFTFVDKWLQRKFEERLALANLIVEEQIDDWVDNTGRIHEIAEAIATETFDYDVKPTMEDLETRIMEVEDSVADLQGEE